MCLTQAHPTMYCIPLINFNIEKDTDSHPFKLGNLVIAHKARVVTHFHLLQLMAVTIHSVGNPQTFVWSKLRFVVSGLTLWFSLYGMAPALFVYCNAL